jgi:cysteine desulfurase/selenocysteine lyase
MIAHVEIERSTYAELPWKFEAGTSMIAEAVGLGAAVDYLQAIGMDRVRAHEHGLTEQAMAGLSAIPGVRIVGPTGERGGLISFVIDGMHPHDIAELLNRDNVCIRAGHHCAQPLMRRLGLGATARASFGPYNNAADVDALVASVGRAKEVFGV